MRLFWLFLSNSYSVAFFWQCIFFQAVNPPASIGYLYSGWMISSNPIIADTLTATSSSATETPWTTSLTTTIPSAKYVWPSGSTSATKRRKKKQSDAYETIQAKKKEEKILSKQNMNEKVNFTLITFTAAVTGWWLDVFGFSIGWWLGIWRLQWFLRMEFFPVLDEAYTSRAAIPAIQTDLKFNCWKDI